MDDLFHLWLKSISELCINKYRKKKDRYYIEQYNNKKEELIYENRQFYDPHFNFKTEFLEGIDVDFSQLWYQYRPCAIYDKSFSGWKLYNSYELKIISPITLKTAPKNIKIKEKYAIKRYYNSIVQNVNVFYINEKPNIFVNVKNKEKVKFKYIKIEDDINLSLYKFSEYSDLIILYLESDISKSDISKSDISKSDISKSDISKSDISKSDKPYKSLESLEIILDNFIPAYPIWLDEKVIVLTPILLQQLNGCDNKNRVQSLYNRIANNLGAILINMSKIFPLPKLYDDFSFKDDDIKNGISDYETGIFKDGRVKKLIPEYTKHIPKYGHGWISFDTQVGIISALESDTFRFKNSESDSTINNFNTKNKNSESDSKVILELGAWLGLSTRIFSNYSSFETTIYSIDRYDNNAIYDVSQNFMKPSEKLYNHLRYETFCSNLSSFNNEKLTSKDLTSRYFFDEQEHKSKDFNSNKFVLMKMDIYEGIEVIYKNGIKPDLILIDFEKKKDKLLGVLKKLKQYFPNCIIVGDDYVFPSVREAVRLSKLNFTYTMNEAYIISNNQHIHKSIIENIKKNKKIYETTKEQNKALKDSSEGILNDPFLKIRDQSSYNINYFSRYNRDLAIGIIEKIYKTRDLKSLSFPTPLHNPISLTFFDYFFLSSNPKNIYE